MLCACVSSCHACDGFSSGISVRSRRHLVIRPPEPPDSVYVSVVFDLLLFKPLCIVQFEGGGFRPVGRGPPEHRGY